MSAETIATIVAKGKQLFGDDAVIEVTVTKATKSTTTALGCPSGHFKAVVSLNGKVVGAAIHWKEDIAVRCLLTKLESHYCS